MTDEQRWDQRYQTGDTPWETGQPSSMLRQVIADEKLAPCRAVDLGCGSGDNSVWLAQQGFTVLGVDLSPLAIEQARERATAAGLGEHRLRFLSGDLLHWPASAPTFHFFFDRGCYHILRKFDATRYLDTVARWVLPGGLGLVLAGNAREPKSPGPPVVTEEEFRAEWGRLFEVVWLREFRFDPVPRDVQGPPLGWAGFLRRKSQ